MSNAFYRMEMLATVYHKKTGRLAPFKDSPMAAYISEENVRENRDRYDKWYKEDAFIDVLDHACLLEDQMEKLINE